MPFSTSLQRMITLNMKFKKALHLVSQERLRIQLKWLTSWTKLVPSSILFSSLSSVDLKNAFGKVHHNSIQTALDHILHHIKLLLKILYTDFKTSITTNEFRTPFVSIHDWSWRSSRWLPWPSYFNLCFNTFLQHIKSEKYRQFGFSLRFLNPIHWFQFADEAAVISGQESENQLLINRFVIWCQCSSMIIRFDKCITFGIRNLCTKSVQYLPKLLINGVLVSCVEMGESFRYLGRNATLTSTCPTANTSPNCPLLDNTWCVILKRSHCIPKNQLLLYSRYVLFKLSWYFTVANISKKKPG